jgi:hypothetical protein
MSELGTKRKLFTALLPKLINKMMDAGFSPMIGKDGEKHMKNSLHFEGLAQDFVLTKDGQIFDKTEDHAPFGIYWENLHPDCCWGGRFDAAEGRFGNDGGHYSVKFGGRK